MSKNIKKDDFSSKTTFIPVIQNTNVIQLSVNCKKLNLRREISLKDFTEKLLPLLEDLENYIDLQNFTSSQRLNNIISKEIWDEDSFKNFWNGLIDIQKEIIRILFENKVVSREKLVAQLINNQYFKKVDGAKKLGAIVAGMTRKWNNLNFKPIFVINNKKYFFNDKLKDKISILLEELINGEKERK